MNHGSQVNSTDPLSTTVAPVVNEHAHHHHNHEAHTATTHDGKLDLANFNSFKFLAHLMKMWFHGGSSEVILFEWWKIETCWGIFLNFLYFKEFLII